MSNYKENEIDDEPMINYSYIQFINEEDSKLIDEQYIYSKYHNFLKLHSDYKTYLTELKENISKYKNKLRYKQTINNKQVTIYDTKNNNNINIIKRPNIKYLPDYIKQCKNKVIKKRTSLINKYTQLLKNNNMINSGSIIKFNKERNNYITLLNMYYSIQYFYNSNNNHTNNKHLEMYSKLEDNIINKYIILIDKDIYSQFIEYYKTYRQLYINAIIDKEHDKIKEYLIFKDKFENFKKNNFTSTKMQELNYNNYIILDKDHFTNQFKFYNDS